MTNTLWSRTRGGSPGARVFAAYVALVLVVAIVGPGLSVYAAEGRAGDEAPLGEMPVEVPEVVVEPEAVPAEEPAEVPEVVPDPEPVVEVAAVASVEAPVVTVAAASVAATKTDPTPDDSNWICAGGVKLDKNPRTGTYTMGSANTIETPTTPSDYSITITTYAGPDGAMLMDFTSNYPVSQVKVKGGNDANFYDYNPAVYSATGLHAPIAGGSGKWADISHIVFCFGDGPSQVHIIATKFHDDGGIAPGGIEGNGLREGGEDWLGGFTFDLYSGPDSDGPWTYVMSATSVGSNGQADFGMHPFGWYKIVEVLTPDQIAAGWYPTTTGGVKIFETTGEYNGGLWFGNLQEEPEPETGDLDVFKYLDANENETYDDGEEMLEGWSFSLYDDEDVLVGGGSTDAFGKLSFTNLPLGDYHVTETLKDGWENTTDLTQYVTVLGDGTVQELWFGNVETELPPETGDLVIHKFEDDDKDGVHDPGEAMLADWEFTVTLESPPIFDDMLGASAIMLIGSGSTDGDGELDFTGLLPNTYTVTETPKPGWDNVTPLVQTVEVVAGGTAHVWFGNVPEEEEPETGDLVIYKYNDLNRNGVHDEGEPMLEDWEFTLTREVDTQLEQIGPSAIMLIGSGFTDEDGELYFGGLLPGEYTVTETPQEGWDNITPLVQVVQVVEGQTAEVWFGNAEKFLPFTELDLAITKVADDHTVDEGQLVKYTLTYWNNGELAAENFTIVDDYDERYLTIVDAAGGVVAGGKITWTLPGPLVKADGMKTITYTARVIADMPDSTTNIDNVVEISHPRDTVPGNNKDNERVVYTVSEPFLPFTGGEFVLLLGFAVAVGALGLLLRTRTDSAA